MLALSIRQPFAELILRAIKTAEYRSRPTKIIGQRFWIYAAKGGNGAKRRMPTAAPRIVHPESPSKPYSSDLVIASPAPWMIDLANALKLFGPDVELPRGLIVGSAVIEKCVEICDPAAGQSEIENRKSQMTYAWHLTDVKRLERPRRPKGRPQPVWWRDVA